MEQPHHEFTVIGGRKVSTNQGGKLGKDSQIKALSLHTTENV